MLSQDVFQPAEAHIALGPHTIIGSSLWEALFISKEESVNSERLLWQFWMIDLVPIDLVPISIFATAYDSKEDHAHCNM